MPGTATDTGPAAPAGAAARAGRGVLAFLFWTAVFGVAYTQAPLYYSNQNQYFLHGLARGGLGFLGEDWLANTADPTPAFSTLVALTHRCLPDAFFYLWYFLLLGAYFHALVGIFLGTSGRPPTLATRLGFLALVVAVHSALPRWSSAQLFGVDYPWYFQAGVANQYVLGPGLQPSVFGALLVLSVATFLRDRPLLAVTWSSLGAAFHSTYLLSAALLTAAYLFVLLREKRYRTGLCAGLLALALVLPVVAYNLAQFAPSSPGEFAEAQHLLARWRLPHHAEVDRWLDPVAAAQVAWVVLAILLARGTRLFPVLLITFTLSLLLTLVQVGTGSDTLALLFPWRTSSILVPVATAVVFGRLVNGLALLFRQPPPWLTRASVAASVLALAACVVGGAVISCRGLGYRTSDDELPLLERVRDGKQRGETYLLPVEVPKLKSGKRGAVSLSFTPPPRRDRPGQHISVDLQRFRLFTGAPIYVDFKSIPYKDVEVLEWHRRVLWADRLYRQRDWNRAEVREELAREGVTHVVVPIGRDVACDALDWLYDAGPYRVYRLRPAAEKGSHP